jgi:hypothetical protein
MLFVGTPRCTPPPTSIRPGERLPGWKHPSPVETSLHRRLGVAAEFVEPAHKYKAHVTVSYVRSEVAEKYVGNQITAGRRLVIAEVLIRTRSRD